MDVGSLLAEVAAETFTEDLVPVQKKKFSETNVEIQSTISILQSSAAAVQLEDSMTADRVLQNVAKDILSEEDYNELDADVDELLKTSEEISPAHHNKQNKVTVDYDDPGEINYSYEKEDTNYSDSRIEKDAGNEEGKFEKDAGVSDDGDEDSERDDGDKDLDSRLILACARPNYDAVISALKHGAYLFCRDRHGWTPLHWVASKGATDLIELLLEKRKKTGKKMKPFVNAVDTIAGWTPLHVSDF
jgi:ankyrin repeat protein